MPDGPGKFTYTMDWDGYGSLLRPARGKRTAEEQRGRTSGYVGFRRQFAERPVPQSNSRSSAKDANTKRVANTDTAAFNAKGRGGPARVGARGPDYVHRGFANWLLKRTRPARASSSSDGTRVWNSSVKPALANGCWVVQKSETKISKFICSIPVNADAERARYDELTDDVTASLPEGWSVDPDPPFTGLPSKAYRSTSGAHGEIWLVDSNGAYELHFELIAAPVGAQAAEPTDDDPIGEGGFITPPTPTNLLGGFY